MPCFLCARSGGEYPEVPVGYRAPISGSSLEGVIRRGEPRIIEDLEAYLKKHPASDGALLLTEELRTRIEALREHTSGKTIEVTMSFGVACFGKSDTVDACISRADGALLRAKREGRNRVVAAGLF